MDRAGARADPAAADRRARRDRGAVAVRQDGDDRQGARRAADSLADGGEGWVTVHPSFLLRLPDEEARLSERARFVADLKRIGELAAQLAA